MAAAFERLRDLTVLTARDPAEAGRRVMAMGLTREVGWMALVLSGAASAFLTGLAGVIAPPQPMELQDGTMLAPVALPPLVWGLMSFGLAALLTVTIHRIGQRFGGSGSFTDILLLMAWLQIFSVIILLGQVILMVVIPFLALMLLLVGLFLTLRALGHFVNEGHHFESLGRSVWVIVISVILVGLIFTFTMALLLPTPPGAV